MLDDSQLGRATAYPDRYDPSQLFVVERATQRRIDGIGDDLPFSGVDIWTAYEISWLDLSGRPRLAIGELRVPADSPALVESKSLKLYLGSFAQEPIATDADLARILERDLSQACEAAVRLTLRPPADFMTLRIEALDGESIDDAELLDRPMWEPTPSLLAAGDVFVEETLRSALFRSNCPVTGQPDYADVMVRYRGRRIDRTGLLGYLVSYRRHAGFHESCVERIFVDIANRCAPQQLTVYARFTRRGGIDINPFRSNFEAAPPQASRTPRQ